MKITKMEMKNFRGFEEKSLEFSENFNVLIGGNGTGKTSILDALAIGLHALLAKVLHRSGKKIYEDDVHRKKLSENPDLPPESQFPSALLFHGIPTIGDHRDNEAAWSEHIGARGTPEEWKPLSMKWTTEYGSLLQGVIQIGQAFSTPCFTYYGAWRTVRKGKGRVSEGNGKPSRKDGYRQCLDPAIDEDALVQWIKNMEFRALKTREKNPSLEAVRNAMAKCVKDCQKVEMDRDGEELCVTLEDGCELPFRMLSDGYRNVLSMVGDIARRAAILNPYWGESAPLETPGVVLIDEIDLHLHPQWQREIVEGLRSAFPKMQFIVTTHSPFIIQSLKPGELIDLDENDGLEGTEHSIEDIAEKYMGVDLPQRSQRYREMMEAAKKYYAVLKRAKDAAGDVDSGEVKNLKAELDELSAPFSDNPAYVAFLEMERKAAGLGQGEA